jgi:hypothetical protein
MKLKFKRIVLAAGILTLCLSSTVYSRTLGGDSGGGGDASEARVDEIREDILNWIDNGGAKGLKLPIELKYNDYVSKMREILEAQKVVVKFIDKDSETNDELKVIVNGSPKTCRGFYSKVDGLPHILCSIPRFSATSDSEQYKLIHHEFAGLKNVEKNDKAASDYSISSQLTEYLSLQTVLKLALKKVEVDKTCAIYSEEFEKLRSSRLSAENIEKAKEIEKQFRSKGYKFVSKADEASIIAIRLSTGCHEGSVLGKDGCYNAYTEIVLNFEGPYGTEQMSTGNDSSDKWQTWFSDEGYKKSLKKAMNDIPSCVK